VVDASRESDDKIKRKKRGNSSEATRDVGRQEEELDREAKIIELNDIYTYTTHIPSKYHNFSLGLFSPIIDSIRSQHSDVMG
jgi:hypothetical protein